MLPKRKVRKQKPAPLALPVATIIEDLNLQASAREVLAERLPKVLATYFEPDREQTETLLEAASRFAQALCANSLVYTWSDYARHLAKTAQIGREFLSMAGMDCKTSAAREMGIAPIEAGAAKIISHKFPGYKKYVDASRSMVAATERAAALASDKAKLNPAPNKDLRKLLDKVVGTAKSHFMKDNLPQKEKANDNNYEKSKYPLLSFAIDMESLSLEAAKVAVDKSPLSDSDREKVKSRIQSKSAGAMITELRDALARRRLKFR